MASLTSSSVPVLWRRVKLGLSIGFTLKRAQLEVMQDVFNGRNCFGILPTGYGYLPAIFDEVITITYFVITNTRNYPHILLILILVSNNAN